MWRAVGTWDAVIRHFLPRKRVARGTTLVDVKLLQDHVQPPLPNRAYMYVYTHTCICITSKVCACMGYHALCYLGTVLDHKRDPMSTVKGLLLRGEYLQ